MSDSPNSTHEQVAAMSERIRALQGDVTGLRSEVHAFRTEIEKRTDSKLSKTLAVLAAVATVLLLPWMISLETSDRDHDRRLGAIENSRMPAEAIRTEIDAVRREMADAPLLRDLRDAMAKLQASQDLTRADVGAVKERLVRVETKLDGGR